MVQGKLHLFRGDAWRLLLTAMGYESFVLSEEEALEAVERSSRKAS